MKMHKTHYLAMMVDAASRLPQEACGLVAGKDNFSTAVAPSTNMDPTPMVRYRLDPIQTLEFFMSLDSHDWDCLAIYHSHPQGPATPSQTDLAEWSYPGVGCLIWSFGENGWFCKAFLIHNGSYQEITLDIIP